MNKGKERYEFHRLALFLKGCLPPFYNVKSRNFDELALIDVTKRWNAFNDDFYLLVNAEDDAAPYHISKFTDQIKNKDDQDVNDEKILNIANKLK